MQLHYQPEDEGQKAAITAAPPALESDASPSHTQATTEEVAASQPVKNLLATVEKQKAERKWYLLLGLSVALYALVNVIYPSPDLFYYLMPLIMIPGIMSASIISYNRYYRTTQALAQIDDMRMIGPLIDRLPYGQETKQMHWIVRPALMQLLPRLKASDAGLLTSEQKGRLVRYLAHLDQSEQDKAFQVVILGALEQVGDAQALPVVEKIAWRQPLWAAHPQVHTVALECLPFLRLRAEAETSRLTLLRPAGQEAAGGELLRPVKGAEAVDPNELLRAEPSQDSTGRF